MKPPEMGTTPKWVGINRTLFALQMFVRLFVDENLDRIIPISKQPKEKIQAIIDSCARQFPEFSDRSRKRIRTYLKSCRRNKKTRDGWENTVSDERWLEFNWLQCSPKKKPKINLEVSGFIFFN